MVNNMDKKNLDPEILSGLEKMRETMELYFSSIPNRSVRVVLVM